MTRTFLHVFGVCWLASYAWMAVLTPVDPVYEILSLLMVAGLARLYWTLRKETW